MNKIKKIFLDLYVFFIAYLPTSLGTAIRSFGFKILFQDCGSHFRAQSHVTIEGFKNIQLGQNVRFAKNTFYYAQEDGAIQIGNNFSINVNSSLIANFGKITIGDNCLIGPNCVLRAANHKFENTEIPINKQGHTPGHITLEDDVWLGANVVVLPNVTIGKSSIIGAGSVVTKDIPAFSIATGIPAKVLKSRKAQ